ncbi:class III extradiol ring-cleavage dioxygenase [Methylovirgula sp. HY1]|uniref:DODA-type extradiol aromatic ring-opening family dioxygenase n=1 Tax=Methylovirgula sp. HY1 TaxID=2822761 RepID=UPI001C788FF2|nr:class III extradiol ring-cleavage dioxygenase [Methylovirgula sp. HY1]QXX73364.1 4,5-DOPA dioxygenase extradiol [Methylovirgula sp. HY1]
MGRHETCLADLMAPLPTLFLSHGAPNLLFQKSPARDFLQKLGQEIERPRAILVASAHFEMPNPAFTAAPHPEMIYDFTGFEDELYQVKYPALGAPGLAAVAADLLADAGFEPQEVLGRGFDHGAWVPLMLMYPDADIPIVELSVQREGGAGHHIMVGRALAPLREHGILIVGSGSLTHGVDAITKSKLALGGPAPDWVSTFAEWVHEKAEAGAIDEIADWWGLAPNAKRNHPTPEHFLPLPLAMGAAGEGAKGRRLHHSVQYGVLAMDAYLFE